MTSKYSPENRPVFLDIARIHMPVTAVISIAHRLTGMVLFLFIPFSIYLLQRSLTSPEDFVWVMSLLDAPFFRAIAIVLLWFFIHHLLAGIRYLLLDFDIGIEKDVSRKGAWVVVVSGVITILASAVWLI